MRKSLGRSALLLLLASCAGFATENSWQLPAMSSGTPGWSLADLDGDRIVDLVAAGPALRHGNRYTHKVRIDLSHSPSASFDINGRSESIRLSLRDVDGDHDRDVVVLEPFSLDPVAIWLNDGSGHFTEGRLEHYSSALGRPGPHSFTSGFAIDDTLAGFSSEQLSFHHLPVVLTLAVAARAPAALVSALFCSTTLSVFVPRGPPSLS